MNFIASWRLRSLEKKIAREFDLLYPMLSVVNTSPSTLLDIAIIGGGQCGLGLCLALRKQKIYNVQIFDRAAKGEEGPWATTARMLTLRTVKEVPGPALLPGLVFRNWFEAKGGNWNKLKKIPTLVWADYLRWYRSVLKIPVLNEWDLQSIHPENGLLKLIFNDNRIVYTRKIVLATGRDGLGGAEIPTFMHHLPKTYWWHTGERIDPEIFRGKEVFVIGAAASAFDIVATALENGSKKVTMVMRREKLPDKKPLSQAAFWNAYSSLSDQQKAAFFQDIYGVIVPSESVARLEKWPNFHLLPATTVDSATLDHDQVILHTNRGILKGDLLMLGTGYKVDLDEASPLKGIRDHILLWRDRIPDLSKKLGSSPYLGKYFEFLEKKTGEAPYLKHIYCFNYGSFLSHGRVAGDIDQLPVGIERLAQGLAIEMFLEWDEKYGNAFNNQGGDLL